MKDKILVTFFVITLVFITSCDNSPEGGNAAGFGTVYLQADYNSDVYMADISVGGVATTNPDGCSRSIEEDDIEVRITSTSFASLPTGVTASDVEITHYTVQYVPEDSTSPAVPTKTLYHHIKFAPDSETTMALRVLDHEDKTGAGPLGYCAMEAFWNDGPDWYLGDMLEYEYTIVITVYMVEVDSGLDDTIAIQFPLHYTDFADADCGIAKPYAYGDESCNQPTVGDTYHHADTIATVPRGRYLCAGTCIP